MESNQTSNKIIQQVPLQLSSPSRIDQSFVWPGRQYFLCTVAGTFAKQHMNDKQQGSFLLDFPTPAIAPGWPPELFQPKLMCIYIYIHIFTHSFTWIPETCLSSILVFEPSQKKSFSIQNNGHESHTYIYIVYKTPRDPITFWEWSWNLNTFRFGGDCWPESSSNKVIGSLEYMYTNRWYIWPKYNIWPRADWHAWDFSRFPETSATFWRFLVVRSHYTLTKYIP